MRQRQGFLVFAFVISKIFLTGCSQPKEKDKPVPTSNTQTGPIIQADDDAKTILAKAAKALGQEKDPSRWKQGYLKYRILAVEGMPQQAGETTMEDTFQLPGHFKRVTRTSGRGKELSLLFVVKDGKGWSKRGDGEPQAIENSITEKPEHPFGDICNIGGVLDDDVRAKKVGEKNDGKYETVTIQVESDDLPQVEFTFDKQTGYLLSSRKTLAGENPEKPDVMECVLEDYQKADVGVVPMRLKGFRNGQMILNVVFLEVRFNMDFPAATFSRP